MCTKTINNLNDITESASSFVAANAQRLLPNNRTKLIDLTTVAIMRFEDEYFSWEKLRNIAVETICKYEFGEMPWFVDLERSSNKVVWVTNSKTRKSIQLDVANVLLLSFLRIP